MIYQELKDINAYIYNRKSTEATDRQVLSLGDQSDFNNESVRKFKGNILEEFKEAKSGKIANKRPIFNEMLKKIKASKKPVWIFCWRVDRLSRNVMESALIMMLMEKGKIEGVITSQRIYHREDNILFLAIDFASAEQYSRDLSKNVKRGMQSKLSKGGWVTLAPFGYLNKSKVVNGKIVDKIVEIDKNLLPYFKQMKKMKMKGKSYNEIAEIMYKKGLRSKKGNKLRKGKIQKIFTDPFYTGMIYFNNKLIKANHTPMWTTKEFKSWQNTKEYNPHRGANYPFSRILFCGNCRHMLSGFIAKKKYLYWRCSNCRFVNSQGNIEKLIGKEIQKHILTPSQSYELMKKVQMETEKEADETIVESMKSELKKIEQKRRHIYTMRENNEITGEKYKSRDAELCFEIEDLKQSIKKTKKKLKEAPKKIQILKLLIYLYQYYLWAESDIKGDLVKILSSNWIITKEKAVPERLNDDFKRVILLKNSSGAP